MIGQKMEKALNDQIKAEMESAYLYLAMATYFYDQNLEGMAKWMRVQYHEEMEHAMKLFDHIVERGGAPKVPAIAEQKSTWASPLAAWKATYSHEQKVTGLIHKLVELAAKEKDHAAAVMLQWFVTEQVEEESEADRVVKLLERMGESGNGLIMLDVQLGKRED